MYINQLQEGSAVTLTAFIGTKSATFHSRVIRIFSDEDRRFISDFLETVGYRFYRFIVVDLFTYNSHPLNFDNAEISCNLMGINDTKPYEWFGVVVYKVALPVLGEVHIVITDADVTPFNRRSSFRVSIGNDCYVRVNSSEELVQGSIKDISSMGVGVVVPKELFLELNDTVLITFYDYIRRPKIIATRRHSIRTSKFKRQISLLDALNGISSDTRSNVKEKVEFIIKGVIVRIVDTIPRRVIGCKFLSINEELSKYVNEKQLEKRRRK